MKFACLLLLVLTWSCTHVETGQPQVLVPQQGSAPDGAADIESFVQPKLADFNSCYEAERQRNPKAAGKVLFAFTVLRNGHTSEVRLLASTIESPLLEGCLVGKMEAWQFPPNPKGQDIKVRYPFSFQP